MQKLHPPGIGRWSRVEIRLSFIAGRARESESLHGHKTDLKNGGLKRGNYRAIRMGVGDNNHSSEPFDKRRLAEPLLPRERARKREARRTQAQELPQPVERK
jgi:hypothetical protein